MAVIDEKFITVNSMSSDIKSFLDNMLPHRSEMFINSLLHMVRIIKDESTHQGFVWTTEFGHKWKKALVRKTALTVDHHRQFTKMYPFIRTLERELVSLGEFDFLGNEVKLKIIKGKSTNYEKIFKFSVDGKYLMFRA